jgi:hypothetical protein
MTTEIIAGALIALGFPMVLMDKDIQRHGWSWSPGEQLLRRQGMVARDSTLRHDPRLRLSGGAAGGKLVKDADLGQIGNLIAGAIGSVGGGQLLGTRTLSVNAGQAALVIKLGARYSSVGLKAGAPTCASS